MKRKTLAIAAALALTSAAALAQKPSPIEIARMSTESSLNVSPESAAEIAATREATARAVSAIPLARSASGPRILPFLDLSGEPVSIGKPLLAFQILPFVDSRGDLIPVIKNGPAILPFIDLSGEPISIGKTPRIELVSQ